VTLLDLLPAVALGGDRQRTVVELDRDLVLGDAGQVERVHDLGLGLPHVGGRDPALGRPAVALEHAVHEAAHLVLEGSQLTERLPANKRRHGGFLLRRTRSWCRRHDKT
jgi:hypothetical protein